MKTILSNFQNIEIIEKDLDLRSYRLSFDKMKKFFNLEPETDILRETSKIIDNFKNDVYGDINNQRYYNA